MKSKNYKLKRENQIMSVRMPYKKEFQAFCKKKGIRPNAAINQFVEDFMADRLYIIDENGNIKV